MARNDPQINVRQPPEHYAILEIAALLEHKGTPGKLVQELVDEAVKRYAAMATVQKMLAVQAEHDAVKEKRLTYIDPAARTASQTQGDGGA
ncbi:MAG TPA: hypothetical protein VG147_04715 [Solirubrobacteraceae bacterium]|jgi:hypothetical protein|nr:hypothetical protein [Solirubrobacteraceae bacterium]